MFDLEKLEKKIIIFLILTLLAGLAVSTYKRTNTAIHIVKEGFAPVADDSREKIDINEADAEALSGLKGIGMALANRIAEYRSANGRFNSIDDLKKVKGIGPKLFEKIKNDIRVE